jgi:hypothetical protein
MQKIKLIKKFYNMGECDKIYYISDTIKSYGYDILDEKFHLAFSFGHQLKDEFTNYYILL